MDQYLITKYKVIKYFILRCKHWSETPAPREDVRIDNGCGDGNTSRRCVVGTCLENKNFYPYNTVFLSVSEKDSNNQDVLVSSFQKQFDTLFKPNDSNEKADLKANSLKENGSPMTQPRRVCSKWGVWSNIEDKCVATCEPLDPFRTNFSDTNSDGLLQNYEITELYRNPKYRSNYLQSDSINPEIKYGDTFTGGAKWGRTKAGEVAVGECDATVGEIQRSDYSTDAEYSAALSKRKSSGFPTEGVQFLRNGDTKEKSVSITGYDGKVDVKKIFTKGRPYRVCQIDGTWGPVQDACVKFRTCKDSTFTTKNLLELYSSNQSDRFQKDSQNKYDIQNIVTLSGGSINFSEAKNADGSSKFEVPLSMNCSENKSFESGTITKTCDVRVGEWKEGDTKTTCALKTCGSKTFHIDYNRNPKSIILKTLDAGKYYPKSSGYKGSILINNKTYEGYETSQACPTGYTCKDCDNNKVNFTCDFDDYGVLSWTQKGECVPITCSFADLKELCSNTPGCNNPSFGEGGVKVKSTVIFNDGKVAKDNSYTTGTQAELTCKTGYYEEKSSKDLYATCNSNGKWSITGSCTRVCDKDYLRSGTTDSIVSSAPGTPGSKFSPSYANATTSGTVFESRYFADGAMIDATCDTGYVETSDGGEIPSTWKSHAYKCVNGEWKRGGGCKCKPGYTWSNGSCVTCASLGQLWDEGLGICRKGKSCKSMKNSRQVNECSGGRCTMGWVILSCTIPAANHNETQSCSDSKTIEVSASDGCDSVCSDDKGYLECNYTCNDGVWNGSCKNWCVNG